MVGCSRSVPVASSDTIVRTVIRDRVKDTTIYITDSAALYAYLECDSLGNARIKEIEQFYAGRVVQVPKIVIKNNWLKSVCVVDSAAVYVAMKLSDTTRTEKVSTVITVKENYLTGWQWAQVWAGRLLILIVLIYVGYRLIVRKLPP
jgi:hypothetical protein